MLFLPHHLPPLGHICAVMLVSRKGNINRTASVCHYNGAQWYQQLWVGRQDQALVWLGLSETVKAGYTYFHIKIA